MSLGCVGNLKTAFGEKTTKLFLHHQSYPLKEGVFRATRRKDAASFDRGRDIAESAEMSQDVK